MISLPFCNTQRSTVTLAACEVKIDPDRIGIRTAPIGFRRRGGVSLLCRTVCAVELVSSRERVVGRIRIDPPEMGGHGDLISVGLRLESHMAYCAGI